MINSLPDSSADPITNSKQQHISKQSSSSFSISFLSKHTQIFLFGRSITVHYELKHFGCLNSMDLIFSNKPRNREKDVERVEQIFPTSDPPFEQ